MDQIELELPSKSESVEVWCESNNGDDSGVEIQKAASCGSSVLSGYSEAEATSECGSDTYTNSTLKTAVGQWNRQHNNVSETASDCSSTHEEQKMNGRNESPSSSSSATKRCTKDVGKSEKPKIPAKPLNLRTSSRTRKVEIPKPKPVDGDGRWPFSAQKASRSRGTSAADPGRKSGPASLHMTSRDVANGLSPVMTSSYGPTSMFMHKSNTQSFASLSAANSTTLDTYGTLPRRKKKDAVSAEMPAVMSRSGSREPSLNRAATLRRQTSKDKESPSPLSTSTKSLPPYPRGRKPAPPKTQIVYEVGTQTNLTAEDFRRSGTPIKGSGHMVHSYIQTEEISNYSPSKTVKNNFILDRIRSILGLDASHELSPKLVDDLEAHINGLNRTIVKQREELFELHVYKTTAQRELDRSLAAQRELMDQQQALESEHAELQEFLQAEKSTLSESLIDADDEISRLREALSAKDMELSEQQEQCKHLVRVAEQRRQENLILETRLAGLEQRSQDVLLQQGAAVSGAAVALTSLGARLDGLVDQLAVSYNVADKDLEDVIFHNEAYTPDDVLVGTVNGDSDHSDRKSSRRVSTFLSAVLSAIRSATQSPTPPSLRRSSSTAQDPTSESLDLLDCDITLDPSSKSSESGENSRAEPGSLQNLSAAIIKRQQAEQDEEDYRSLHTVLPPDLNSLLDKVITVDNSVTKLLKVMRIIQMENDTTLDQIADQRSDLDEKLRMETVCRAECEQRMEIVETELKDVRAELSARILQLEEAKHLLTDSWQRESQRQYESIDNALETLQSMQDVVDQFPQLAKLQQQLEDCNFRTASGDDLNANSPNGPSERTNGSVRTTAI